MGPIIHGHKESSGTARSMALDKPDFGQTSSAGLKLCQAQAQVRISFFVKSKVRSIDQKLVQQSKSLVNR